MDRPAFLEVEVKLYADNETGSTDAIVDINIDESGGTTADVTYKMRLAGTSIVDGKKGLERRMRSVYVPAGGQFQLEDVSVGGGFSSNSIELVRAIVG